MYSEIFKVILRALREERQIYGERFQNHREAVGAIILAARDRKAGETRYEDAENLVVRRVLEGADTAVSGTALINLRNVAIYQAEIYITVAALAQKAAEDEGIRPMEEN